MSRRYLLSALICANLLFEVSPLWAQPRPTFPQSVAERHGLTRAWTAQVELDRTRDRLINATLDVLDRPDPRGLVRDALFLQTDHGLVQAVDAETGRTLWATQVGNRTYVNLAPVANDEFVVAINGATLYCLDRADGHIVWEKVLKRAPSEPPMLGPDLCFVPSYTGHMSTYELPTWDDELKAWVPPERESRTYQSFGRINVPPLVTPSCVAWGTSRGFVFVTEPDQKSARFRFDTSAAITAPLGYWPPYILAASRDGYLYAIHNQSGESPWSYTTGNAINKQPVAINGKVYVIPEIGGMFCLSIETGAEEWIAPDARKWVAASQTRFYVCDQFGKMLVLAAQGGGQMDALPTEAWPFKVFNIQTDRIYLATPTGLVICLREQGSEQPLYHRWPDSEAVPAGTAPADGAEAAPADDGEPAEEPAGDEEPVEEEPAEEEAMEAEGDAEAAAEGDEEPFN
jgi:hypothetical protein